MHLKTTERVLYLRILLPLTSNTAAQRRMYVEVDVSGLIIDFYVGLIKYLLHF